MNFLPWAIRHVVICNGSGGGGLPVASQGKHWSIAYFTFLSLSVNQTFSLSRDLVFTQPWWVACARSIARFCSDCGITILFPHSIRLWAPIVSSSLTCQNGLIASQSHRLRLMAARKLCNVLSQFVASIISVIVMVFGTAELVIKLMYCSVICSC